MTPYAIVHRAWGAYRRSQEVPWPATGGLEVLKARTRLHEAAAAYANGEEPLSGADLAAIEAASADLAEKVRRYCGDAAGAYVSGESEAAA